jgi:hypothetical protein
MGPEKEEKNKIYTAKGITGLAELEILFIERADRKKEKDYEIKVAKYVLDLERITEIAKKNEHELPGNVVQKIKDLELIHADKVIDYINKFGLHNSSIQSSERSK